MNYPLISIAIATFNSQSTLKRTLNSIIKQTYPEKKIEILIIDGGSHDKTLQIAEKFPVRILDNPKTDLIFAKEIAYFQARGKYLMYLDSDEVLENTNSLTQKCLIFQENPKVKAVMIGGYKTPKDFNPINYYINEFGDPFSYFLYKESKGDQYLVNDWRKKYNKNIKNEDSTSLVLNLNNIKNVPLIELCAGGSMIDIMFCRKYIKEIKTHPELIPHLFYFLNQKKTYLALSKNDFTIHYSSPNIYKYFKKISSRVRNNVFVSTMGKAGHEGRERFHSKTMKWKKYLFIPYSFSIIFPVIDSLYLSISRKKYIYLFHVILCLYTSSVLLYYYSLKIVDIKPRMKVYGT